MKIVLLTPPGPRMMNPLTLSEDMVPPKTWVPLGIAYLAGALRANGFDAELRDLHDYDWDEAAAYLDKTAADVVGISCFTFSRASSLRLASVAKQSPANPVVIMGGPHATLFPEQLLASKDVDIVVLGQGEQTIVSLAECLAEKKHPDRVNGIVYKNDSRLSWTAPRAPLPALDGLAFPAYEAFDLDQYKSPEIPERYSTVPGTHIISSRGCPFHCSFCSVNKLFQGTWAFRSPANVVDELEWLVTEKNLGHVYFSDDLFTLNQQRTVAICKEILARGLRIPWMAETRVDCVSKEMLAWMRKAGCYRVYYGVESGSPRILKNINKGFSVEQVRQAFAMTHAAGLEPCCFLMIGNPGESPETIMETIELVLAIRPATLPVMGITTLLPGTEQYSLAQKQRLIDDSYWLSDSPPPLYTGEHSVDDLIYLQMLLTKGICPELFEHLCQMGFDESYFRLRRMTSFSDGTGRNAQ